MLFFNRRSSGVEEDDAEQKNDEECCSCGVRPEFHFSHQIINSDQDNDGYNARFRFPNRTWEPMPVLSTMSKQRPPSRNNHHDHDYHRSDILPFSPTEYGASAASLAVADSHRSGGHGYRQLYQRAYSLQQQSSSSMPNVLLNHFCRQLVKDSRRRMYLTQADLARRLYMNIADIKALESGQRPVARSVMDVVLYTLNIRGVDESCLE